MIKKGAAFKKSRDIRARSKFTLQDDDEISYESFTTSARGKEATLSPTFNRLSEKVKSQTFNGALALQSLRTAAKKQSPNRKGRAGASPAGDNASSQLTSAGAASRIDSRRLDRLQNKLSKQFAIRENIGKQLADLKHKAQRSEGMQVVEKPIFDPLKLEPLFIRNALMSSDNVPVHPDINFGRRQK